ncbi:MAG: FtsW/RodA/SpoVE family cell cycle protein [Prevotellaceae bacterium]|jgi:cell division protein FtsW|nr:FtsW/RodA/SpoVE family cell cycle protein [Prevotellaceae bacterium]
MSNVEKYLKGDKTIWFIALLLSIFSLLLVYSSTVALSSRAENAEPFDFFMEQLLFVAAGFALIYVTSRTPYTLFMSIAPIAYAVSLALMTLMLLIGSSHNQAVRTLLFFQPAELCKVALILYVARQVTLRQDRIKDFRKGFLPIMLMMLLMILPIFLTNFSTAAILALTCFVILFIGRARLLHLLATVAGLAVMLALALCLTMVVVEAVDVKKASKGKVTGMLAVSNKIINKTRLETIYRRLEAKHADSVDGSVSRASALVQSDYAHMAIASSGLIGKGPGNSDMRYYLPEAYSDFVFAIVVEEYGVVVTCLLILCYLILLFRVGAMVRKATHFFPAVLAIGIITQILVQALVHMSVATGIAPVTGQNLPLVSKGGSSMLCTFLLLGMLLSISRSQEKETLEQARSAAAAAQPTVGHGSEETAAAGEEALAVEAITSLNPRSTV